MMRTVKICGWATFIEKIVFIVLLISLCFIACSCMSMAEGCASNSIDRINDVDKDSITAGYEVLGNLGTFVVGGMTYASAILVIVLAFVPFILYVIAGVVNIVGLVKLREMKTGAITASAVFTIIVDVLIMLMYVIIMSGEIHFIMATVCMINIIDIIVNAILIHNANRVKRAIPGR